MNPTVSDPTRPGTDGGSSSSSGGRTVTIRIRRQDGPGKPSRWEEFRVPHRPQMNIISCLMWIAGHPVTFQGKAKGHDSLAEPPVAQ